MRWLVTMWTDLQTKSLRELMGRILLVLYFPLMGFMIFREWGEYRRLPEQPTVVTAAVAMQLADQGARPFVQITDAGWDCTRLTIVRGKRSSTYVALQLPVANRSIVVHYWGRGSCAGLANKTMVGVLQPIGGQRYNGLRNNGFPFDPQVNSDNVYELCGYCSRQYSLSQLKWIVGILLFVIVMNLGEHLWRRNRPPAVVVKSTAAPSSPPLINNPVWLNGKICLDAPASHFQRGTMLEVTGTDATPERFAVELNGRGSHLLAGGHLGSEPGNRLLRDVIPPGTSVTLKLINPDGVASSAVPFQR